MDTTTAAQSPYKGFRFPAEIISYAVWLYFRFALSYRDVEDLLAERGVLVTYESVRQWCRRFGQAYANQLRQRRARPGDKWPLDEVLPLLVVDNSRARPCISADTLSSGRIYLL